MATIELSVSAGRKSSVVWGPGVEWHTEFGAIDYSSDGLICARAFSPLRLLDVVDVVALFYTTTGDARASATICYRLVERGEIPAGRPASLLKIGRIHTATHTHTHTTHSHTYRLMDGCLNGRTMDKSTVSENQRVLSLSLCSLSLLFSLYP